MINDPMFHKSVCIANQLQANHPELLEVECLQFFETQWILFLKKISNDLKGVFYEHDDKCALIYLNGKDYIGDANSFAKWALFNFNHIEKDGLNAYNKMASETYSNSINSSATRKYASMTFTHCEEDKKEVSNEIVIELFSNIAPKTCENFLALCNGFKRSDSKEVGYCGTEIHRIVRGMYI